MANTRFKTENGLLVTGGNAEFVDVSGVYVGNSSSRSNLYVEGDLVHINGNLVVTGVQQIVAGQSYTGDILAGADGLNFGNSVNQFNAHLENVYVYTSLNPVGNTIPLGNSTNRWVAFANTLDISRTLAVTGNVNLSNTLTVTGNANLSNTLTVVGNTTLSNTLTVTGNVNLSNTLAVTGAVTLSNTLNVTNAVTLSNTLGVTGAVTLSNTLAVTGTLTASSNVNFDSGVLFVDGTNNRVGINNTAPGVALRVTGAVDISSTSNVQGNANVGGTLGVTGATTLSSTLAVTSATTLSNNLSVAGNLMVTSACTHHISGNTIFSGGALFIDAGTTRIGMGTLSPDARLQVAGSANINGPVILSNTLGVIGSVSLSNTLNVAGNTTLGNASIVALVANGSPGTTGQVLTSNSTGIYWSGVGAIGGSNTHVQFNDSGVFGGTAGFTFNKTTNNLTVGNTITVGTTATVNGSLANLQALNVVNQTNTGTLFVASNANVGGTLGVSGAANLLSTLGVSSSVNALSTLGVNGLITGAAGLTITGITNTSSAFNVGGGVATTNGVSITNTSIAVGNSSAYTNIQALRTTTFIPAATQEAYTSYANSTGALWMYAGFNHWADSWNLNRADGTAYLSTLLAAYRANNSLLLSANSVNINGNSNFDFGTLFVDSVNNRVGINNTAPGVALRVTGAADISSTANIQGNANVGGTLGVAGILTTSANVNIDSGTLFVDAVNNRVGINNTAPAVALRVTGDADISSTANIGGTLGVNGAATFANVIVLNDQSVLPVTAGAHITLRAGRNHASAAEYNGIVNQVKIVNTAMIAGRTQTGIKSEITNESRYLASDGTTQVLGYHYGLATEVYNGNSSIGGDAYSHRLWGVYADVANYANGVNANGVNFGIGAYFLYASRGSGVTTSAYGSQSIVTAANNSVTGNITTAYGVTSIITSNTAMTIGTGYLFYGDFNGSTTTTKYGLYLNGESNNYISGNAHFAGTVNAASYRIGTSTLVVNSVGITHTGFANITDSVNSALLSVGTAATINSTLANLAALNVVNQTNTATLFVTTSANVGTSMTVNSTVLATGATTNANFDSGVLFVDAVNNRVGVNNTAPAVALRVTGAADISSTANIQGNANVGGTLGAAGLITGSAGLTVTGITNTTTSFNVGTIGTTNGSTMNSSTIMVGNSTSNMTMTGSGINYGVIGTTNGVSINSTVIALGNSTVNNYITSGGYSGNVSFDTGTLYVDAVNNRVGINNTAPAVALRVTGAADISSTANIQGNANVGGTLGVAGILTASANVNFDSGTLFVDQTTNRVGINNTAPAVALRVTGDADISSTANIQGNANVGGTLGVNGTATFANVIVLNDQSVLPVVGGHVTLRAGRNHESAAAYIGLLNQAKIVNTAMTAGRTHLGIRSELVNESRNLGSDGITQYNVNYAGFSTVVYNGNNVTGGNARAEILYGVSAVVENWANGALANTVDSARAGEFAYRSRGSGGTTNAYGVSIAIAAANNSVTGNITTAYGVSSVITSNTAMTIGTGYLYYGDHNGTTTTTKYGLYLTNESNNYISGNAHFAGTVNAASYRIGAIGTSNGVIANTSLIRIGNSTANATISSNGISLANGIFSGNGIGLTSTTYVSSYALATDTNIFVGGDSNTWKLGATYTPTIEQGVSTIDIQVYAELYFKQFSDNVPTGADIYANASSANIGSLDIGFGGGNPLMRYRLTKTYSGGNTTLYTSDYITISAAGTIAAQLNTIRDTTPSVGSGTTYRMEYEWVPVSSIPTGNLGTVSITSGSQTLTGSGTEFQGWINPRNTITIANSTNGFGTGAATYAITQVRGPTSILMTLNALDTRSGRYFSVSDPYANVNMSQQYLSLSMTGYK